MTETANNSTLIYLSSSSEDEEQYDDVSDDDEEEEESAGEGNYEDEEEEQETDDEAILAEKVIRSLNQRMSLDSLTLKDCKSYLRKHGLRIAGTKAVCMQRIEEHWRIKDGHGETFYPRPSFVINCTGDVCQGDVVLFSQNIYAKFDKMMRHGRFIGKRTIAGKVIRESYGAGKQQHTFTVEVLWSRGVRKLPPLFCLLVKGRNLYRLKTFRQQWNNEAQRRVVLAEKHRRGEAARVVRAMQKRKKAASTSGGAKGHKRSHQARQFQTRTIKPKEALEFHRRRKMTSGEQAERRQWQCLYNEGTSLRSFLIPK